MPYFCQFCDKEMPMSLSVVDVCGYITCGCETCTEKAKRMSAALMPAKVETPVILFSSRTPEDDTSWKAVPKDKWPDFVMDENVMKHLLRGDIASVKLPSGKKKSKQKEVFYRAKTVEDVKLDVESHNA